MAVTIAPATEAAEAIVARLNSGTAYCLDVRAEHTPQIVDALENLTELRCDVCTETEEQLNETLDVEDRTSHVLTIWVRSKVSETSGDEIDALKLLVRQIFQRVNNYDTTDRRVMVWDCDLATKENPDKEFMRQHGVFISAIQLRVEVGSSA